MTTRLMVLGLLSERPMSGYEILQAMQMTKADMWAGILTGSIYHALKKMEQEGLVFLDAVERTGHRSKATYRLTERGRAELVRLVRESLAASSVAFPTGLYAALSFLHLLPRQDILEAVDRQIRLVEDSLSAMKAGEAAKREVTTLPAHVRLAFENIFEQHELQLRFLRRLRQLVEDEGIAPPPGGKR
jgi:DNA-binding PadR family transcriptional regulator